MRFPSDVDRIADLLHAVESRLDAPLTPQSAAQRSAWSLWHFHRKFQEVCGESYAGYVRGRLLYRAAEDLLGTKLSIDWIATGAAFANVPAFYKAFRRQFGMAPMEYRRNGKMLWFLGREPIDTGVLYHVQDEKVDPEPEYSMQPATSCDGVSASGGWSDFQWLFLRFREGLERSGARPDRIHVYLHSTLEDVAARRLTVHMGVASRILERIPEGWETFTIPGAPCAIFRHHGGSYERTCIHMWRQWRGRNLYVPEGGYSMQVEYDGTNPFSGKRPILFHLPLTLIPQTPAAGS